MLLVIELHTVMGIRIRNNTVLLFIKGNEKLHIIVFLEKNRLFLMEHINCNFRVGSLCTTLYVSSI